MQLYAFWGRFSGVPDLETSESLFELSVVLVDFACVGVLEDLVHGVPSEHCALDAGRHV